MPHCDLFCRVIDNHGDLGVCWRLAADLAARGRRVRLWVDDAQALAWMAPQGAAGVEPRAWDEADAQAAPGEVVIEAFGCELPPRFAERMAARAPAPLWINLEYLSAEAYVERSHRLPSPQRNGLTKWFFYPGFGERTGGLLREPGLLARREAFDAAAWLAPRGLARRDGERLVSLFCYDNAALPALLDRLAAAPTLLLLTAGHAARQVRAALGDALALGALRAVELPYLTQTDFDRLLWACDLNFVRGEDSAVRAMWAGSPFVWQFYPQSDGAHHAKREAFLDRFLAGAPEDWAAPCRAFWRAWNGAGALPAWPAMPAWRAQTLTWRNTLAARPDLASQLLGFVAEKR
ncbi:elongation factor P maturation arginine rhamnosyltransferase EarP [Piscinibacter sp.]|uniref:elongation factor P maturation arginine rhamnosyltransferase EarP n=1 Tax=Piscinibacter sp. TaxID=1903157 RepID=UPI0039E56849